jgi:hypothetical protein
MGFFTDQLSSSMPDANSKRVVNLQCEISRKITDVCSLASADRLRSPTFVLGCCRYDFVPQDDGEVMDRKRGVTFFTCDLFIREDDKDKVYLTFLYKRSVLSDVVSNIRFILSSFEDKGI